VSYASRQDTPGAEDVVRSREYDVCQPAIFLRSVRTLPADVCTRVCVDPRVVGSAGPLAGDRPCQLASWLYRARARALMLLALPSRGNRAGGAARSRPVAAVGRVPVLLLL